MKAIKLQYPSLSRRFWRQGKKTLLALAAFGLGALPFIAQAGNENNDDVRAVQEILGVSHNVAYPGSFLPLPLGLIPGATAYGTNLGLKFVPPVLEDPADVSKMPNTADSCGYILNHQRPATQLYQDFLHLLINFDGDYGEFGNVNVEHWNTDVEVTLKYENQPLDPGVYTLNSGPNTFKWLANTMVTPILDYPPYFLLNGKVAKHSAKKASTAAKNKAARRRALKILQKMFKNAKKSLKRQRKSWLDPDGIPSANGTINNQKSQSFTVYDIFVPQITSDQDVFVVEATDLGGEKLNRHIDRLRDAITATDKCGVVPRVNYSGPSFLPVGVDTPITWTASDSYASPGRLVRGEVTQTVRVQDTKPPIMVPPRSKVVLASTPQTVDIGGPAVFDLASLEITICNDLDPGNPTCSANSGTFQPNTRTPIQWTATDGSLNQNSTTAMQWVTVKSSNTPPSAEGTTIPGVVSFEQIDIPLVGTDPDIVSNIPDPLFFEIESPPSHGSLIAPPVPYFIEDYRIASQFNATSDPNGGDPNLRILEEFREECTDNDGIDPDRNFVYQPKYVSVLDDGSMYVVDTGLECDDSPALQGTRSFGRVALFQKPDIFTDAVLISELDLSGEPSIPTSVFIGPTGDVSFVTGARDEARVNIYPANLDSSQQRSFRLDQGTPPNGFKLSGIANAAVDSNGIMYATDGSYLYAYDALTVDPSGATTSVPADFLGDIAINRFFVGFSNSDKKHDMAFDSEDNLYVSDPSGDRIVKFSASQVTRAADNSVTSFTPGTLVGWMGKCAGNLTGVAACDVENYRSFGYSCTDETCEIARAPHPSCQPGQTGGFCRGGRGHGQFDQPAGIAMDPNDTLYVTDYDNSRIQRFNTEGVFAGEALSVTPDGSQFVLGDFGKPRDISVNSDAFYILDEDKSLLHVLKTSPVMYDSDTGGYKVTYQSENNYLGLDSFVFSVDDGLATDEATINISMIRNSRAPTAFQDLVFTGDEDTSMDIALLATDPDADLLSYDIVTQPKSGSISQVNGDFVYTPNPNFYGTDVFQYTATDNSPDQLTSEPGIATIMVRNVNDPPKINAEASFDAGRGYQTRFEADIEDVDLTDTQRMVIDWGDGIVEQEGEVLDDGTTTGPIITNGSDGTAGISAEHMYTTLTQNPHNLRICISDIPSNAKLTGCNDPDVNAVHAIQVQVIPMVELAMIPTDNLPKEEGELGVMSSLPIEDGNSVTYSFELHNIGIDADLGDSLTATNVMFDGVLSEHMVFDAVRTSQGTCSPTVTEDGEQAVTCAVGTIDPTLEMNANNLTFTKMNAQSVIVEVDVTFDGKVVEDVVEPIVGSVYADQDDPSDNDLAGIDTMVTMNPQLDSDEDGTINGEDAFPGDPNEQLDTDTDGIGNNADLDDDGDQMPDSWENQYGLDALLANDNGDPDGDGLINLDEYRALSNPNNPNTDGDKLVDGTDNCPSDHNFDQGDEDEDGIGNACDQNYYKGFANLTDSNGNGAPDIAGLRVSDNLGIEVQVSDASTGLKLRDLPFLNSEWNAKEVLSINDGLASPSVAVRGERMSDGVPVIQIKNSATGSLIKNVFPWSSNWKVVDFDLVPNQATGGPAIATLARRRTDGLMGVELRDPVDGSRIRLIYPLGVNWTPHEMDVVPNVNGSPAIAVLATRNTDGLAIVQVRNAATGDLIRNVYPLGLNFTPHELRVIPDVDGDGVWDTAVRMTRDNDGLELIQIRNTVTQELIKNVYPIGAGSRGWSTQQFKTMNQNGQDRLAILSTRDSDGAMLVQIKDPATGDLIKNNWMIGVPWTHQQGFEVISDFNANNTDEIGVLTENAVNGLRIIQLRDGQSNQVIRNVFQPN